MNDNDAVRGRAAERPSVDAEIERTRQRLREIVRRFVQVPDSSGADEPGTVDRLPNGSPSASDDLAALNWIARK